MGRWLLALWVLAACGGSALDAAVEQDEQGPVPVAPGRYTPATPPIWVPEGGPFVAPPNPGPWPTDAVQNLSHAYHLSDITSVGIDDAYDLWLLDGNNRIGVLRPGDASPSWAGGIGQAGRGFGSTVICGGASGQAYVGYWAKELDEPCGSVPLNRDDPSDGDMDVVQLGSDGKIALQQHLNIFNSNDHHCDETRAVFACTKVMRGALKGEIYIGTNHAVTRIRGLDYSDHRHSVWDVNGSLRIGYNYAVSITPHGDVLFANEWKVAMLTPTPVLEEWIDFDKTPWKLDTWVTPLNSLSEMDYWRATAQSAAGVDYFGSLMYGLWRMPQYEQFEQVKGIPSNDIAALAATDDGSVYVGTIGAGLWRIAPDDTVSRVAEVPGENVSQVVYDPTTQPSTMLVLSNAGVFMLRGR
jgi:hypothetical protein